MGGEAGTLTRRFSLASSVAVVFATFALASVPTAAAQETLAASCEPREGDSTGWTYVAQSFTPQLSGALTRAEINVRKSSTGGDYVVEIRTVDGSSRPTDTLLATASVPDASVPTGESFISASFPNPANVVAGLEYALVVHRSADLHVGDRVGDDCPGIEWFSNTGTADWNSFASNFDMVFRVFVTPAPQATCKGEQATHVGTEGDDEIRGTDARDVIAALGGNDNVRGLGGNDLICGGAGRDSLRGGKNKDKLLGQAGKDTLRGQGGKDRLFGKGGKDKLNGGTSKDVCKGGKKDDKAKKCEVEKSI